MSDQADGLRRLVRSRVSGTGTATPPLPVAGSPVTKRAASGRIEKRTHGLLAAIAVRWGRALRSTRRHGVEHVDYSA